MSDRLPASGHGEESPVLSEVDSWDSGAAVAVSPGPSQLTTHGDITRVSPVASLTKLVTAWAVLIATEEGAIRLDDPAGPPGATVAHLLAHSSGLDFDSDRVLAPAGTRRIYSNTGYVCLASHVEVATGFSFAEYQHEAVLAPLGMDSSVLVGSPASGLVSSVNDLALLAEELRSPTLIHRSTAVVAESVQFRGLPGVLPGFGRHSECDWGFGPEIKGKKVPHWSGNEAPPATFGHFGASGSFLWIDPVGGFFCVVVTGRDFGDWAVRAWPAFSDRVRGLLARSSGEREVNGLVTEDLGEG